jgi:hypothetical protein
MSVYARRNTRKPKCTRAETHAPSSRSRAYSLTDYSLAYSLTDYATAYSLTDAHADSLANGTPHGRYDIVIGSHVQAAVCSRAFAGVRARVVPGPASGVLAGTDCAACMLVHG